MKGVGRLRMAQPTVMTPGKIITVPGIPGHFIQVCSVYFVLLTGLRLIFIIPDRTKQSDPGPGTPTDPGGGR